VTPKVFEKDEGKKEKAWIKNGFLLLTLLLAEAEQEIS